MFDENVFVEQDPMKKLIDEAKQEGLRDGLREVGIKYAILDCKDRGMTSQEAIEYISSEFKLKYQDAVVKINENW